MTRLSVMYPAAKSRDIHMREMTNVCGSFILCEMDVAVAFRTIDIV